MPEKRPAVKHDRLAGPLPPCISESYLPAPQTAMTSRFVLCGLLPLILVSAISVGASLAAEGLPPLSSSAPDPTFLVIKSEFIFEKAPFASCHASTIAETPHGLVAAWFGGSAEGRPDVGIWVSRHGGRAWATPIEVATGANQAGGGARVPCWNPVLYQTPNGPLLLFFKAGPSPSRWWGLLTVSEDGGRTWAPPRRLPEGFLGPVKNKPIRLSDGSLLCPSSTEDDGWRVHLERTADLGRTWTKTAPLNDGLQFAAIQPTILFHPGGRIQLLCRSRQGRITECWSLDGGKSWQPMRATGLPNPNSGIDAVTLRDGRQVLVYNPTTSERTPLALAVSNDGREWKTAVVLENGPGEFSYPAVIQAADGLIHVTYTWKRERIKHVVVDPGGR
jgi:predicted neuraminidase